MNNKLIFRDILKYRKHKIRNKTYLCFNEWVKQLIYCKTKVFWIDKTGTKNYLFSKKPILDDNGNIDYKELSIRNKENEIKIWRWLCENRINLLLK